jgi:hypothetical protein
MRCFINGLFFQRQSLIGETYKPGEGAVAVIREGTFGFYFSGYIDTEARDGDDGPPGALRDEFGFSELRDVIVTDTEFGFKTRYDQRPDEIEYRFRKLPDGSWVGHYEGEKVGRGVARCMLTPAPVDFYDVETTLKLSDEKSFHEWGASAEPAPKRRRGRHEDTLEGGWLDG